jgi:hypothetical protein
MLSLRLKLAGQILVYQEEAYCSVQEAEVATAQREATQAVFTSIKAGLSTGLYYIMLARQTLIVGYCGGVVKIYFLVYVSCRSVSL